MNPAVASLLRRLASIIATSSAATASDAALFETSVSTLDGHDQFRVTRTDQARASKLVYGRALHGASLLAFHGSHRSHSSHASHASHYSGTSGSSGSSYGVTPASPASPTTRPAPEPQKTKPDLQKVDTILSQVLQKLPRIRSRWPKEAVLTKVTQFNLFEGDKIIGITTLRPGAKIKIIEIKKEHAVAKFGDKETPLPVGNTDIVDQMGGAEKILALPDDEAPEVGKTANQESGKK